jgi:hypothetical protein
MLLLAIAHVAVASHSRCADDWLACRAALTQAIFNASEPPSRPPDYVLPNGGPRVLRDQSAYLMHGLPGPGNGTGVGAVSWENNLTALVWTIKSPFVELNATVLYSLNTSSRAPANYHPPPYATDATPYATGPDQPTAHDPWNQNQGFAPQAISDTLLIYHNGHETVVPYDDPFHCTPNYDGVVDHFNRLGYDVMELDMPLIGT